MAVVALDERKIRGVAWLLRSRKRRDRGRRCIRRGSELPGSNDGACTKERERTEGRERRERERIKEGPNMWGLTATCCLRQQNHPPKLSNSQSLMAKNFWFYGSMVKTSGGMSNVKFIDT